MKAKLDFTAKTIELDYSASFDDIREIQQSLSDWREWRIVQPMMTVTQPFIQPYYDWTWRPYQAPTWTYTDTTSTGKLMTGEFTDFL